MEKSIESIWKEGFLENDALVAPTVNNLYNQKSKLITDRLKRMFKINLYAIVVMAVAIWIGYAFLGVPWAGLFIFLLLMGVFALAIRQGRSLKELDHGLSSYEYLKAFNHWIHGIISSNVKVMRFFYPLVFLASMAPIWYAFKNGEVTGKILLENPDIPLIFGIPVVAIAAVFGVMLLMTIFGGRIYRWDVHLVYGGVFRKLDGLVSDMEELRK
ncbi:MAG: hypothetical protein AAF489_01905 [Bacteroidota bacterium]